MTSKRSKIEAEKIFELDKNNLWANVFLLSIAEEIEDWEYAEKKAKDLKKTKGYEDEINLSKYTLQKGIIHLNNNNLLRQKYFLEKQLPNHLSLGCHINI